MLKIILISFLYISMAWCACGQSGADSNFHLYILMGQSNMAGRGEVTNDLRNETHPRLLALSKENEWVQARHPLHFDKPAIVGVGPGMAFGIRIAEDNPMLRIGLVPSAVGGSSIRRWKPGAYDQATASHPYDDAMVRIKAAMKAGMIKGVLWHQGESDIQSMTSAQYVDSLAMLIQRVRTEVGDPNLPFIMGEIGRFVKGHERINTALKEVMKRLPYAAVASSKGLLAKSDGIHFDSPSARVLGQRFAKKMLTVQRKLKRNART